MAEYSVENIRNIHLVAGSGTGKSSLAEAILYSTNKTNRLGRIEEGNTISDFTEAEKARGGSVSLALMFTEWNDTKINIFDSPGYMDFVGEVYAANIATDGNIIPIASDEGIGVRTCQIWELVNNKPTLFVINKFDKENVDFNRIINEIKDEFGHGVVPFTLPIGAGESFQGVVDIISQKAYSYERNGNGKGTEVDIPAELKEKVEELRLELVESVAESDDELLEKYFEEGTLSEVDLANGLNTAVLNGKIYPCLVTSAYFNIGVDIVLDAIIKFLPSPKEYYEISQAKGEQVEYPSPDEKSAFSGLVFKTFVEQHVGRLSFIKATSGTLTRGDNVYNKTQQTDERIGQLYLSNGNERVNKDTLIAGDIAATVKLKQTATNDILVSKDAKDIDIPQIEFPAPVINVAVKSKEDGDEEKMAKGFTQLSYEDPTFRFEVDPELKQTLLHGQGELHLNLITQKLKSRFDIDIVLMKPKIPYRETISKKVEAQGKFKKQTGGHGQYGDVHLRVEPLPTNSGFVFEDAITGGVIPSKFIPSVEKGIKEAMDKGILAGYKITDIKVVLYDGSHHPVDSSDKAFAVAGSMGFKKAFEQAGPYLLEPIYELTVIVPPDFMGDVVGDISARRGSVAGMESQGRFKKIKANVPLKELYKYSTVLRSITQGRGVFITSFSNYEKVPRELQKEIIDQA